MDDFVHFLTHAGDYVGYLGQFIGAASVLASVIPGGQSVGLALGLARKALDVAACNFGHAANKNAK